MITHTLHNVELTTQTKLKSYTQCQSCERGEREREGQDMHFFNIVKKKGIQAGWVVLQSALPFGFNQIKGGEKHEVAERNNKAKNKLKGKDAPLP